MAGTTFTISSHTLGKRPAAVIVQELISMCRHGRKMFIEPEMQLPRFNDARAIPDFRARDFRDSLKKTNSLMNQMDKRGAIAVRNTHSVGIDCLPMFGDWNTCHVTSLVRQFYFRLPCSSDSSTGEEANM